MSESNGYIWGLRRELTCPSGQKVLIRLVSGMSLVERGILPLGLIAPPSKDGEAAENVEPTQDDILKNLNFIKTVVEAGVTSPKIGTEMPYDEIPDGDRMFLFTEILSWLKEAGGLGAVLASRGFLVER